MVQIYKFGKIGVLGPVQSIPEAPKTTGTRLSLTHSLTHTRQVMSDGIAFAVSVNKYGKVKLCFGGEICVRLCEMCVVVREVLNLGTSLSKLIKA